MENIHRFLCSIVVVAAFFLSLVLMEGGQVDLFVDLPTLLIVLFFPLLYALALFGVAATRKAFLDPLRKESSPEDLQAAFAFFTAYGRATWLFALASCGIGAIRMLSDLTDYRKIGFFAAVILLSILYAAMIQLLLIGPYLVCAKRRRVSSDGVADGVPSLRLRSDTK